MQRHLGRAGGVRRVHRPSKGHAGIDGVQEVRRSLRRGGVADPERAAVQFHAPADRAQEIVASRPHMVRDLEAESVLPVSRPDAGLPQVFPRLRGADFSKHLVPAEYDHLRRPRRVRRIDGPAKDRAVIEAVQIALTHGSSRPRAALAAGTAQYDHLGISSPGTYRQGTSLAAARPDFTPCSGPRPPSGACRARTPPRRRACGCQGRWTALIQWVTGS